MNAVCVRLSVTRRMERAMDKPGRLIKGLGEIALRVADLAEMQRFYQNVVGLEVLGRSERAVFFAIANGYGGHTQALALFDRSTEPGYRGLDAATSTIDHIAFEIDLADYEPEKERLEQLGVEVTIAEHAWVHWRSLYVTDPEGNLVEWVCYDETVGSS
jgi:catechol 2,3-dioxygenase